jgi:ATP-binding cassette subfamily F protein 3
MISFSGVGKRYGRQILFLDASFQLNPGEKAGLVGPNGAGKTTVFRMISGEEHADDGDVAVPKKLSIGYFRQEIDEMAGRPVLDEAIAGSGRLGDLHHELIDLEHALSDPDRPDELDRLVQRFGEVQSEYQQRGGYELEARAREVLHGLGFPDEQIDGDVGALSGGWKMRVAMAKLLLGRPDVLLMDEPTNHLDLPARNWLEEYLADYPGSVVLVSHDRYFLDATVKRITEVGLKTLTDYHGNYSKYVVEHEARMERLLESHRRQSEEIEKAESFINKFRYQATKARQVQSRIKALDKVERIEIPPQRKKIRFKFPSAPKPGRVVLELKGIRRVYGTNVVLDAIDMVVERGDRIALVGPNGAGKSTLMRIMAGVDRPDGGTRVAGHQMILDYFAQDQAAVLDPTRTAYEEMSSSSSTTMVPMIRTILGGFLFSGDDIYKKCGVLSGGERNRLALAKMLLHASNVLVLDEPTNHLDLDSKEVLLEALSDYGGTLIFVSHDRYFVDKLATKVVEVGGGQAPLYPGGYEDFLYWKKQQEAGLAAPVPAKPRPRENEAPPKPTPKAAAPARPKEAPKAPRDPMAPRLRRTEGRPDRQGVDPEEKKRKARITELERRIAEKEKAVKDLETQMASPGFYDDRALAEKAATAHKALMWEVGDLMNQWEMLQS